MISSAIAGFVYGILGSMHCIGMCGPLILVIPFQSLETKVEKAFAYLLYGAGKTFSYMILGLLFGLIGSKAQQLHMQRYVSIIAGVLLLLSAVIPMLYKRTNLQPKFMSRFNTWINAQIAKQFKSQKLYSFGLIGFLNGLLPCGFIYAAIFISVTLGSVVNSISFMLFFGIATMLSLTVFSLVFQLLPQGSRNALRKLFPYLIILTALLLILRGLELGIPVLSPIFEGAAGTGKECCSH